MQDVLCGAGVLPIPWIVLPLAEAKADVIVLDSAHMVHSENVLRCLRMIKEAYPDLQVVLRKQRCNWRSDQSTDRSRCRCR